MKNHLMPSSGLSGKKVSLKTRIHVEWNTWASLALVAALLEGSVIGIVIKNGFQGLVSDGWLNVSVAIATGAPFFANLLSFYWVSLSLGRSKARLVSNLAILFCISGLFMSVTPFTSLGLVIFLLIYITSRMLWSGILTIRSNIWRANYPRHIRGKVTAKLATLAAIIMSVTSIIAGWLLDWQFSYFRILFAIFAILSLWGAVQYRLLAVRHQQKEIERENKAEKKVSLKRMINLLKNNKAFAHYMLAMFLLGMGNLMFMAPLIIYFNEQTELLQLEQILLTTAIPLALIPIFVAWWARLLDRSHIFAFRSIHSWVFVVSLSLFATAQIVNFPHLFYLASFIYGFALAGGIIGWNLGHNDFVKQGNLDSKENPMDYMAIHVSLTGLRGLIAPVVGVSLYQWLESLSATSGRYALLLPLCLTMIGALLFVRFNRLHR
ncbi:MAG: MFS transporter [Enterobacterales bacterium]|nr:MFS transporter [Enterobacterales bacterium]